MLTRKQFYQHLMDNGCEVGTFEGVNRTGNQIEIINKKNKAYFFISSPIVDYRNESPKVIERACSILGIELPKDYD